MSINADEKGNITFYNILNGGFFSCKKDENQIGDKKVELNFVIESLYEWINEPNRKFQNTAPLDDDKRLDLKTFCKSIYKCQSSNDVFFVLWKSSTNSEGNIQGADPDGDVTHLSDSSVILDDKLSGKKLIWGLPSYYWYISELDIFASIKFPHSCINKMLFERYIRDFALFRMKNLPFEISTKKDIEINNNSKNDRVFSYHRVTFGDGQKRYQFELKSIPLYKKSGKEHFSSVLRNYKYIVIRDTISATDPSKNASWWVSLIGSPLVKSDDVKNKKIEVIMDAYLDQESFEAVFEYYQQHEMNQSEWSNIGFRESRDSATKWFDEYVVRDSITCSFADRAESKHLSASKLAETINARREVLLEGLRSAKDVQYKEYLEKQKLKMNSNKEIDQDKIA